MSIIAYYGKIKKLWDELQSLKEYPMCTCGALSSCTCQFLKKLADLEADDKLMQFLLGLNSGFDYTITKILSMDPLPSLNRDLSIAQKVEKHKEVSGNTEHITESSAKVAQRGQSNYNQRFNPRNNNSQNVVKKDWKKEKNDRKCDYCKGKGHTMDSCFELHGYPNWYNALKVAKNSGSGQKIVANVTIDQVQEDPLS
ncbi:uncharacterized protein LOC110713359 [Chenopodium quinoa]|uniref:uncharacterized protein LOC110713359 n=1 Tax=Chenopodium quinoa TaxID=63459 RepID=UPI000B77749A|nr:uncharacterized protein LOC110713359 [Chenopodium quinoa]XP_021747512.1 uncharacterized protein LOC110713359 [Chenopodium quinoa]